MTVAAELLFDLESQLVAHLGAGRSRAIRGPKLAEELGISERTVRALVEGLVDDGWLIGSVCSGERPGYFRIVDFDDLEAGTAHLLSRSRSMLHRYKVVRDNARARFGDDVLRLFDLEEVDA